MRSDLVSDLADCTEFRQTLRARPPRALHGTAVLATALVVTGLVWAAATDADVVVTAPGVVRPVTSTHAAKTRFGGRVVRVFFCEGQAVAQGDVLVQLDTDRLDNDMQKRQQTLRALEDESAKLADLLGSLARQLEADTTAIEAKLALAETDVLAARRRRDLDIRQAQDEMREAEREEATLRRLVPSQAVSQAEVAKAVARVREARTKLVRAELPVEEGQTAVCRQELAQAKANYTVKRQEVEARQSAKQGEVRAARKDLDNLRWERDQACIRAPVGGVIVAGEPKEGEIAEPGRVVAELAVQQGFRFEVQVSSADVGPLREGMAARVKLAAFDYERYGTLPGTIGFVSPDSKGSEPGGPVYTVRIDLEGHEIARGEFRGRVKLGMTGQAEIVIRRESVLALFGKKVRHAVRFG
jgi:multidrug efflux pump subunit AcrA (membrane-fusion protein)